jgi:hypothetical protein
MYSRQEEGGTMGEFLLGIIVGIGITLTFVIYDEGEYFLRLHQGVKRTMERYKQQTNLAPLIFPPARFGATRRREPRP